MGDADFRHQRQDERNGVSPRPFVFLRPRTLVTALRQELRTAIHWSPRIELQRLELTIEVRQTMVERVVERHTQTRVVEREQLAMRLLEKGARTEDARMEAQAPRTEPPGHALGPIAAARPPMTLNQPPKPGAEPRMAEREVRSPLAVPRTATAPPIDLIRLTDSVMRQIDRRLEAHRERLWRK
jgi:hypothetical protein